MVADEALLAKLLKGALAQLVERLLCKQDAAGSSPTGSTSLLAVCPETRSPGQPDRNNVGA